MKTLTLLIVLALFFQFTGSSQPCLPDGITFTTQEQIDNFQTNYADCSEIEGGVRIGVWGWNTTNISNLDGLNGLTSIGGHLVIWNTDVLTSLVGLDNVSSIGGDLLIYGNDFLTSLTGLGNLTSIEGNLSVGIYEQEPPRYIGNPVLTSLTGLGNVTSIGGNLFIYANDTLTSLMGIDNLTSIGGRLSIFGNDALISLTGLDNIDSIPELYITNNISLSSCEEQWLCDYLSNPNGSVNIYNNAPGCNNPSEIANACGITLPCLPYGNYYFHTQSQIDNFATNYPDCTILEGRVIIMGDSITNLNGLDNVTSIGGDLNIDYNNALISLTGLDNMTSIGGNLTIGSSYYGGNSVLTSLSSLEGLTSIGGYLEIARNSALTSLTGLDNVAFIEGDLTVRNNNALSSLTGLANLTSINGKFEIISNDALTNMTELEGITSIWESLVIQGNNILTSLTGLNNVTSIGGDLIIGHKGNGGGNPALTSLVGLESLTAIGGDLWVRDNDALSSLTGLDNVTSIGAALLINKNDSLLSLTGLDNIDAGSIENLYIYENISLSTCEVQSICNYLASPNGTIEIYNNATGCDNQEEVEEACDSITGVELNEAENYSIYPNPVEDIATFSSEEITSLELYDIMGALIIKRNDNKVDMSNLNPGIYFVIGFDKNNHPLYKGKIIKSR